MKKLTKKAAASINSYADVGGVEVSASVAKPSADTVDQTLYVPILFPNCDQPQWALVDSGAQVSLITTTCAKYCNLVDPQYQNVVASNLRVGGINGKPWQTARLETTIVLGN